MDNFAPPPGPDGQPRFNGEEREESFSAKIPCNPLISLVLHERIQGNPNKSNAYNLGFQSETASGRDNPSGTIGAHFAAATQRPPPLRIVQEGGIAAVKR
jgi:hypothetical protein